MSSEEFPTDLNGEYVEHTHLLSSNEAGWNRLSLIHELEPAGEMPEVATSAHTLVLCLGDFQGSFYLDGQWHQEQYSKGDIALVAVGELFPRVKVDREVSLLELFLAPDLLLQGIGETNNPKIKLRSLLDAVATMGGTPTTRCIAITTSRSFDSTNGISFKN